MKKVKMFVEITEHIPMDDAEIANIVAKKELSKQLEALDYEFKIITSEVETE